MSEGSRPDTRRGYRLGRLFWIRAAGVPFEVLDRLGSPEVAGAARALLAADEAIDAIGRDTIARSGEHLGEDDRALRKVLKRQIKSRRAITAEQLASHPWLGAYAAAARTHADATAALAAALQTETARIHDEVRRLALAVLPDFAVIESEAMHAELAALASAPAHRDTANTSARQLDRALAMYLQRVCAKSDTISKFGPSGWGEIADHAGLRTDPVPGIAARSIEVERWVVAAVIDVMNADPEVRPEICPRVHPDARLPAERGLLAACDGRTPAYRIGDPAALAALVEQGLAIWQLERFALDASPLASLRADVASWRDLPVRARWLARLEELHALALAFGEAPDAAARRAALASFGSALAKLGVAPRDRGRTLYAAGNPIVENCARDYRMTLGAAEVQRLIDDASPWFDLFHDAYALAVDRAFVEYRALAAAARTGAALTYSELVASAPDVDTDAALVRIGAQVFTEVGRALDTVFAGRADAAEWALAPADCHVLRRLHALPRIEEFTYPQADLAIAAASTADIAAGRYRWIVAELHHPFIPLQHVGYWSCPDKPALHANITAATAHQPFAVRGALTAQPVHIGGEAVLAAVHDATFVGAGRPKPSWRHVRRADAEVIVDDDARDVRLRGPDGKDLGSLIRTFRIMMGMHPFFPFQRAPHAPRLCLGTTVVQRQTWHMTSAEVGEPRPVGVSRELLVGVERMRRTRDIPRWIYARATPDALRTFDPLARDKDLKPFYVDLESTLYLEIFERRLRKFGALVVSEMLPAPGELPLRERDGRYVFELRTSVVPR